MPRVGQTIKEITEKNETRMAALLQELKGVFGSNLLADLTYVNKLSILADIYHFICDKAMTEHDLIIKKMNPVNINVWCGDNIAGKVNDNVWWEPPYMDCVMDDEAYAAQDALTHIQAIRRVYCDGPEVCNFVRQAVSINHHDTTFFTDVLPATLHDLADRVWHNVGNGRGLDRLILERYIFTHLMDNFGKENNDTINRIFGRFTDEDMDAFVSLLRKALD